ncbi:diaminopimelate decarboxylase [Dehalogenimonas sp. THU2]|uniref:diaminopimelate decarboxylase n=1 Tax=Dehalogenimonas sp. THU2 TaxID=3151121 RepID=UPI003218219E
MTSRRLLAIMDVMKETPPFFPVGSTIDARGHLVIGGCDAVDLAKEYGTPLYVFAEDDFRARCHEFKREFGDRCSGTRVVYAGKAFLNRAIVKIVAEEGLGLDVVSGGELEIAGAAGFPMSDVYFHGNNKSDAELELAVERRVGRVVIDNTDELERLDTVAAGRGVRMRVLFRIRPGIDPHTHAKISTGNVDSKFGFSLAEAGTAVPQAMTSKNLDLAGFHYHIGSQIFGIQPFLDALKTTLEFVADMKKSHGFSTTELDIGGGYAVQYLTGKAPPPPADYAEAIIDHFNSECRRLDIMPPVLTIEPGRALVARAAVALYTLGAIKNIPGIRQYACVDGGMADNIRPALYGAEYEPFLANRMSDLANTVYTVAGRFCESGDTLATDIKLPDVKSGDILVMPVCGAYCLPMASNYNAALRPAVIMVKDGRSRMIRRRETLEDLLRCDIG